MLPEALIEFSVHGARYAFPAVLGAPKRGVPTSFGALPLSTEISSAPGEAPVWSDPRGKVRGPSLSPLHRGAPEAALAETAFMSCSRCWMRCVWGAAANARWRGGCCRNV